ncbi:MAG: RNA polymerase sigma factor [Bacteroidota bacterium]
MDTAELIEGCKQKSRRHQDALFEKYSRMLYGVCLRYTKNGFDAEDVLQEGLVKIYKNIHMYSINNSFEGWIRRIMINTAITHYRKNLKHAYHADIDDKPEAKVEDAPFGVSEFTQEELLNVINALPDGYRMVFNMYVIEGYKHKEIAEILGIDINTSKSQLSRAKKYLQKELLELSKINLSGYE